MLVKLKVYMLVNEHYEAGFTFASVGETEFDPYEDQDQAVLLKTITVDLPEPDELKVAVEATIGNIERRARNIERGNERRKEDVHVQLQKFIDAYRDLGVDG